MCDILDLAWHGRAFYTFFVCIFHLNQSLAKLERRMDEIERERVEKIEWRAQHENDRKNKNEHCGFISYSLPLSSASFSFFSFLVLQWHTPSEATSNHSPKLSTLTERRWWRGTDNGPSTEGISFCTYFQNQQKCTCKIITRATHTDFTVIAIATKKSTGFVFDSLFTNFRF